MRRVLGSVVPAVLLVALPAAGLSGCGGDDTGTVTDDPAPSSSQETSGPSDPKSSASGDSPVDFELVEMITETAAGGTTSEIAIPLPDADAASTFTEQFQSEAMPTRVQKAVADAEVPDDMLLYGAVVAIGCDSPTDVTVSDDGSGLVIAAQPVPNPLRECFAPMTTVALVMVPASAV